jgi:hypothetical protein
MGRSIPVVGVGDGGERLRVSTTATSTRLGSAVTVSDGGGVPWSLGWGKLDHWTERGRRAKVEESCLLPYNPVMPPPWISPEASGSRSCSMDLAGVGERAARSTGVGGVQRGRTAGIGACGRG